MTVDEEKCEYCKIFVKATDPEPVKALLSALLGGTFQQRDMTVDHFDVAVLPNSYATDPPDLGDDFVVWPTMIELGMDEPVDAARMVATTSRVLVAFWDAGLPAVAACDYEDELPWAGGIQRVN